jgi:UDP-2,3-diacylglucosamine pyrophosphatase LpxH
LAFLHCHEPEFLYLVGDIIDGWRLKRSWYWRPVYNLIFERLLRLSAGGTRVRYTPGNHDAFLRPFVRDFGHVLGFVEIRDEFQHVAADGRRFLVLHGDQFDNIETQARWLSVVGAFAYDTLVWVNSMVNGVRRRLGLRNYPFSAHVKQRVKSAVTFVSDFERSLGEHARKNRCQGIICGHVHTPVISHQDGIVYCNTGDWVEHCSALVEYDDGSLEIVHIPHETTLADLPEFQGIGSDSEFPVGSPLPAVAS